MLLSRLYTNVNAVFCPPLAKKWGLKKDFLLASLAEIAPPHFQNRGAAPTHTCSHSTSSLVSRESRPEITRECVFSDAYVIFILSLDPTT